MTGLLVTLTVVEVVLFVGAVAVYVVAIIRSLRRTSSSLAKVSFGVRAIERQCEPIGPSVTRINGRLQGVAAALERLADSAEQAGGARR